VLRLHASAHLRAGLADDATQATEELVEAKEGKLNGATELAHDIIVRQGLHGLQLLHLKPHEIGHGVRHWPRAEERGQFALVYEPTEEASNGLRVSDRLLARLVSRATLNRGGDHAVHSRAARPGDEAPLALVLGTVFLGNREPTAVARCICFGRGRQGLERRAPFFQRPDICRGG
jgi:hypothetical protein